MAATVEDRLALLARCTFGCGTRAAYVRGCRCEACREANRVASRERYQSRRREAEAVAGHARTGGAEREVEVVRRWTLRSGEPHEQRYRRGCPGLQGAPCASGSYLRRDSTGGICHRCRRILTRDLTVSSARARAHIQLLSRIGVGRRAVADASGVDATHVARIASGARMRIRKSTERKILSVNEGCRFDGALVPASEAWRHVERLLGMGWSRTAIARALGQRGETPGLQISQGAVRRSTAERLARLADRVERAGAPRKAAKAALEELLAGQACPRCGASHAGDPLAASWCLEHRDAPLSELELLHTAPGTSPGAADNQQPRRGRP